MGEASDYVPVALTKAFRDAQTDEKFRGWLKMQEASMGIEFPIYDLPEIRDSMYTKDSLPIVEQKLLDLYQDSRDAFIGEDHLHRTMRFVYYIGETYRRSFEGIWVTAGHSTAVPRELHHPQPATQGRVDQAHRHPHQPRLRSRRTRLQPMDPRRPPRGPVHRNASGERRLTVATAPGLQAKR